MLAVLIILAFIAGSLGLLGLCAVMRAGQCSRMLEESPQLAAPPASLELPRAA